METLGDAHIFSCSGLVGGNTHRQEVFPRNEQRTAHVRGQRSQAFVDLVRGIAPEHILCVSLDISKYFHVVMIHNGLGEIVTPTFDINIYQSGFDQLCQAIERAKAGTQAPVVLVGMERTSHYLGNWTLECKTSSTKKL